ALGQWERVDARADLFSLGVILYEILTGQLPFHGPTAMATLMASIAGSPPPPRELAPGCPLLLEDLCLALLRERESRLSSAEAVAEEIEAYLAGAKEQSRRAAEAASLAGRAEAPAGRYLAAEREREGLLARARALLQATQGFEPIEKKRPGWELED